MYYILVFVAGGCLQVNPEQRLTVANILERLAAIAESRSFNLREPLHLEGKKIDTNSRPGKKLFGKIYNL